MATGHIPQIFLRITVQNQIHVAQRVVIDSALRYLYSCDLCDTSFLIRFRTHSRLERAGACRGEPPPSCWRKTALPLKSPTGAFIAAQPRHSHFRRKRKIRTLLQSETGSDFSCLVGAGGFEPPKLKSSRFTVCPHWPLGNTPIYSFSQSRTACIYYHLGAYLSTAFYSFFRKEADRTAQSRGRP